MQLDRLGYVDVGARGGAQGVVAELGDRISRVMIEPDAAEADRLTASSDCGRNYHVIGKALGHIDGPVEFNPAVNPFCSSVLKSNMEFLRDYHIKEHFVQLRTETIECARYDTEHAKGDLPIPHIIKIDVQGFEYQVLQGFGHLLNHTLAITLETHFYQLYRDQKLLHDIIALLGEYDFVLRGITNDRTANMIADSHFDGDIVEVDAKFTKNRTWLMGQIMKTYAQHNLACHAIGVPRYNF